MNLLPPAIPPISPRSLRLHLACALAALLFILAFCSAGTQVLQLAGGRPVPLPLVFLLALRQTMLSLFSTMPGVVGGALLCWLAGTATPPAEPVTLDYAARLAQAGRWQEALDAYAQIAARQPRTGPGRFAWRQVENLHRQTGWGD